jgi:hypothetical protein
MASPAPIRKEKKSAPSGSGLFIIRVYYVSHLLPSLLTYLFSFTYFPRYAATLNRTQGNIPEFVNPKYADAAKTTFTKPTRLECMMQDYPKLLEADAKVGFTQLERWVSFSAVKNNVVDAKVWGGVLL